MNAVYLALSIPFFFILIGIELWVARRRGRDVYRFADAITNLSCGIGSTIAGVFLSAMIVVGYAYVYEHVAWFKIPKTSALGWVALIFGIDFCYYLYHRASHRINFLWAGHVVHHQSEEYNLAVALRQSWFVGVVRWLFYLPMVLLGFSPLQVIAVRTINTLYQFWIHTRLVRTIGPLEWILNTPSHHRVHHGINPKYIDSNFAGMFIIWDRLLGTWVPEDEEPVYGTVTPLASYNPWWANIKNWVDMARVARSTSRVADKFKIWFAPPEWRPKDQGGVVAIAEVSRESQEKYQPSQIGRPTGYVIANFVVAAVAITAFLLWQGRLEHATRIATAVWLVLTMVSWGALLEDKAWARPIETLRLPLTAAVLTWVLWSTPFAMPVAAAGGLFAAIMLAWLYGSPGAVAV